MLSSPESRIAEHEKDSYKDQRCGDKKIREGQSMDFLF